MTTTARGDDGQANSKNEAQTKERVLTDEQKERIRRNRERALEIQKERQAKKRRLLAKEKADDVVVEQGKDISNAEQQEEQEGELEPFEMESNVSRYVTKTEAMKTYCLPEGTLQVCKFEERPNPRNKMFAPMKLYFRDEIRRRARERFGGMEGLIAERKNREEKRFKKDMETVKDALTLDYS